MILDSLKRPWIRINPTIPIELRKVRISNKWTTPLHRSGWSYAINALLPLHHEKGILFDGFLDESFGRSIHERISNNILPYREPWIGFLHRPSNTPSWNQPKLSLQHMLGLEEWNRSLEHCRGIFCLSNYMRDWLEERLSVPVCSLVHPTETPVTRFNVDLFMANPRKSIASLGWSQRRLHSIFELDGGTFEKLLVADPLWAIAYEEEKKFEICGKTRGSVKIMHYLSKQHYDQLLSQNIAFLHLYDSSANNAIIECIVRNTPILVNPLPAVREYLGETYPLYFETLDEAAKKLRSNELILQAHYYLMQLPKECFSQDYFRTSFMQSTIYSQLPSIHE